MPDFQVNIKTSADMEGARRLKAELESQIAAMKRAGLDASRLEAQLQKVNTALSKTPSGESGMFGKLKGQLGGILSQIPGFEKLSSVASALAAGPLGLVAAGIGFITSALIAARKAINEFASAQEQIASLDQAVANTGQLTDAYRQRLQELAGQLQDVTSIADDKWLPVLERLTKMGAAPDTINKYADAVKNLAGIMGGDVSEAANVFGRALAGNFDILKRYGITVDENATQTQKLEQAMGQLAQKGAGILEAKSQTLNGQFRTLKNATGDLFEAFGNLISKTGILQSVLFVLAEAIKLVTSFLPSFHEKLDGITNRVPPLKQGLEGASKAVLGTGEAMDSAKESAARLGEDGLAKAQSAAEKAAAAFDKVSQATKKLQSEQDELDEALTDVSLAANEKAEAEGKIDPVLAKQLRAQLKQGLARRKAERARKALEADKANLDQTEGQAKAAAESAMGKAVASSDARDEGFAAAVSTGAKSDQQIEIERIQAELAKKTGRTKQPLIQGEKRRVLEENLKNLRDRVGAGALTFSAAQTAAEQELAEAQKDFEITRRGPSRGVVAPEKRASDIAQAKSRVTSAPEKLNALSALPELDKRQAEARQAASEAARNYLDTEETLYPKRREVEHRQKLQKLRSTESTFRFQTENVREGRGGSVGASPQPRVDAPSVAINAQAVQRIGSEAQHAAQVVQQLEATTVQGMQSITQALIAMNEHMKHVEDIAGRAYAIAKHNRLR
jgi:hypothetical protein